MSAPAFCSCGMFPHRQSCSLEPKAALGPFTLDADTEAWSRNRDAREDTATHAQAEPEPIDMVLFCPNCGTQHIDEIEEHEVDRGLSTELVVTWANPPHRSHRCRACEHIWRPADVPTNGVLAIATKGKDDDPIVNPSAAKAPPSAPGWVLVPVEPTEAMMDAAEACSDDWPRTTWKQAWSAMLAAAPSAPTEPPLRYKGAVVDFNHPETRTAIAPDGTLYLKPVERSTPAERVPLTEAQLYEMADSPEANPDNSGWGEKFSFVEFARLIEKAHGIGPTATNGESRG